MKSVIQKFDLHVIGYLREMEVPFARLSIFIVYFWFGILKLLGVSPAGPLVQELFEKMIWFMSFPTFYFLFSLFEITVGIIFLIRGWERIAIFLLGLHIFTTILPLIFLPQIAWHSFLVPTLEGQYIIKNILIVALAIVVGSKLVPIAKIKEVPHKNII